MMVSYLLFHVGTLNYALPLDNVSRIMMLSEVTPAVGKDVACDGMIKHEEQVIDVYSFRTMIGHEDYVTQVEKMFVELKGQHKAWVNALEDSVNSGVPFTKTTDPHACHLGKWIDNFSSYHDGVNETKRHLNKHHQNLHHSAVDVLETYESDPDAARAWVKNEVQSIYNTTIGYLDNMATLSNEVANDSQKLLIMEGVSRPFGLKVDSIDDIIHVEESVVMHNSGLTRESQYLKIIGAMEYKEHLVSVIESITVPEEEV
jgi:chemotaxis signal transduction protein